MCRCHANYHVSVTSYSLAKDDSCWQFSIAPFNPHDRRADYIAANRALHHLLQDARLHSSSAPPSSTSLTSQTHRPSSLQGVLSPLLIWLCAVLDRTSVLASPTRE